MPLMITLMNLIGAYLRYLPFSQSLSEFQIKKLWKRLLIWSICSIGILMFTFKNVDVHIFLYKLILYVVWLPYLAISFTVIKNKILQHIFVMGMQGIWVLFLHTLSGSTITILLQNDLINKNYPEQTELIIYFAFFLILLPIEQRLFRNMLPGDEFFKLKPLAKHISVLPLIMFIGYSLLMLNNLLFQTWSERISRLMLLLVFFIIYRSIMATSQYMYESLISKQNYQRLEQQLISLKDYNLLMQENQDKISIMRHDLRHHYRLIYSLLENNAVNEAMKHIKAQEISLDEAKINKYCYAPLINSALTIYFKQAYKFGIKVEQKINLPQNFTTDENDLAILLSNLLENAIEATKSQISDEKILRVKIQHHDNQCVLEIFNFCDKLIKFDEDGLPIAAAEGHGIGMLSLRSFVKKYNAYVDFSQVDNKVNLLMYWKDNSCNSTD